MFHKGKRDTVERLFVGLIGVQMLSFISQIIANVIDAVAIKRCLGTDAMAAFSFAGTAGSIVMAAFGFLMTGVSVLMSRNASEQDETKRNSAYSTAIILALITGSILTIASLGASRLLAGIFGAKDQLQELTASYIRGYALGILPYLLFAVLSASALIDGGKKQLMVSFALMAAVDVVLDFVNGYVLHLDLWGMGAATAVSEYTALAVVLIFHLRKRRLFRFVPHLLRMKYIRDVFDYGYMYVVKQLMITLLGFTYNNYIITQYGTDILAVYASSLSALSLLQCMSSAIGNTVSTLTGFYAKEEDGTSLKSLLRASIKYSVLLNSVIMLIALVAAGPIMQLFYKNGDDFFALAVGGFRLFSLSIIFRSINMSLRGYYQSMKMQANNLLFTFLQTLACEVVSLLILDALIGKQGIWLSYMTGEILSVILFYVIMRVRTRKRNPLDAMMMLPETYLSETARKLDTSCHSIDEVICCSRAVAAFCDKEGADSRVSGILSLAIEEIAGNIVQYGFADGKAHSIDIRVKKNTDHWIVRIHDDCRGFDPTKYLQEGEASEEHNGIRLIRGLASEILYTNALGLNHLSIRVDNA